MEIPFFLRQFLSSSFPRKCSFFFYLSINIHQGAKEKSKEVRGRKDKEEKKRKEKEERKRMEGKMGKEKNPVLVLECSFIMFEGTERRRGKE